MNKSFFSLMKEAYSRWTISSCLFVASIVLLIDYFTGREVRFPITYVIPVAMAAWSRKKVTAYLLAILLPLIREVYYFLWHESQPVVETLSNTAIAVSALIFYAFLVGRTAWQTMALQNKVKVLEGILPICASCKRIRTESGEYQQMEQYISEHSEASFTHGICPECIKKLYPEYYDAKLK